MAVRIAIVGLGNCASSLVQGLSYYRRLPATEGDVPGLMHVDIGGIKVGDIHLACAFDIDQRKIGQRVGRAVFSSPNNSRVFCPEPEDQNAMVFPGALLDGVAGHTAQFGEGQRAVADTACRNVTRQEIVKTLRATEAGVLVNYLPVGSQQATEFYAQACLDAGVALVNCIPVFIASDAGWQRRFAAAKLPLVGDDVKSQFGATIIHRMLVNLAVQRGIAVDSTYQLNVGGNADFLNMLEKSRLASKKISKTEAVTSEDASITPENIHIGPSDYIAFLRDNKVCYVRMNARGFGGLPMELDLKLSVEDSPNSAGVVVDAVRCAALAQQLGIGGPLVEVCAALMKHPPQQMPDTVASRRMDDWITQVYSG